MKRVAVVLCILVFGAGCRAPSPEDAPPFPFWSLVRPRIETEVPVEVRKSPYLGLTEAQILERAEAEKLLREPGVEGGKCFVGKIVFLPTPNNQGDGYVISRCHILTFRDGRVVKHEAVNRYTGHISFRLVER